jgi:hypothetical protein
MVTRERALGRLRFVVVVGCLAIVGALTGTANAEPTGGNAITVTLFNCSGPAGTPSSFDIQKEQNPSVAAHVVGETFLFKRTSLFVPATGETVVWGPKNVGEALITCSAIAPSGNLVIVTGFFTGS